METVVAAAMVLVDSVVLVAMVLVDSVGLESVVCQIFGTMNHQDD